MLISRDLLCKLLLSLGFHVLSMFNKSQFCSDDCGTDNPRQTSLGEKNPQNLKPLWKSDEK